MLFAPLLKSIARVPGFPAGGAYNVFVPGLLIQLGLFGAAGVGFSLISELRFGVVERLRVTPVSRLSLLLGRALRDVLTLLVQSLILVALALPFGLSFRPLGILIALGLVATIGLLVASISYALALALKDENSFAPIIFTASLPLLLLLGSAATDEPSSQLAADHLHAQPPIPRGVGQPSCLSRPFRQPQRLPGGADHGRPGGRRRRFAARSFGRAVA